MILRNPFYNGMISEKFRKDGNEDEGITGRCTCRFFKQIY